MKIKMRQMFRVHMPNLSTLQGLGCTYLKQGGVYRPSDESDVGTNKLWSFSIEEGLFSCS